MPQETYLGDGVYAVYDHGSVWVDCRAQSNLSIGPTGVPGVCLEPYVLRALLDWVKIEGQTSNSTNH